MPQLVNFQVGDKLVRFSNLYTITEIKEQQSDGENVQVLFFEPLYKNQRNETLVCSIPVNNIERTNIRRPLTEEELGALLSQLADPTVIEISFKRNIVLKRLNENEADELVEIIKNLWIEKTDDARNFTVTKRNMFQSAVKKLSQEIAFVREISLEDATQLIIDTLTNAGEYQHEQ